MKRILSQPANALYLARVFEAAGFSACMPFALLHFMEDFGLSAASTGAILSVRELMPVFLGIFIGYAVHHYGRKNFLVWALVAMALAQIEYVFGWGGHAALYAASVLSGVGYGAMRVACASAIPDVVKLEDSTHGFGMLHAAINLGFVIGPLMSSHWVAQRNFITPFYLSAFFYLLSAAIVKIWLPEKKGEKIDALAENGRSLRKLNSRLRVWGVWGCLFLVFLYAITALNGIRGQMHLVGLAKYLADYFHSTKAASFYWVFQSLLVTMLAPLAGLKMKGWKLSRLFLAYVLGSLIVTLGNLALSFFDPSQLAPAFILTVFLTTLGEVMSAPCVGTLLVLMAGEHHVGLLMGIVHTTIGLGFALGSAYGGFAMHQAIVTHDLPFYWKSMAMVYFPSAIAASTLGFYALYRYEQKTRL